MEHSVCFTGHRVMHEANRLYLNTWLPQQIRSLYARGFRFFYSGGAMGFDLMAAEAVLALRAQLPQQIRSLYARGFRFFYSGGAMGFDLMAAEAVLALRAQLPELRLCMLLPCRNQQKRWTREWRARYNAVLCAADTVEFLCESDFVSRETFLRRDNALVERSAVCVAFYNRSRSGTGHTVRYARALGKEIILTAGLPGEPF